MKSSIITDRLFGLLKDLASQKPVSVETALPSLDEILGSDAASEMTLPEIEATKNNMNLLKLASHLGGSKSVTPEEVERCLTQLEEWLDSKLQEIASNDSSKLSPLVSNTAIFLQPGTLSAPSWRFFHESFLILESLRALSQITTIALKKGSKVKLPKDRLEKLVSSVRLAHDCIRANVRSLKLSEPGMLSGLIDLVLGGTARDALEKTLDVPALELLCGELMESWEEGLDGMLAVTL